MRQAIDIGSTQDPRTEIRRLFDLQAASRWPVARSTASERRKKLQRFKASLEKHRAALAEGIRRELGRAPEESEVIDIHPSLDEINYAIAHLAEWMRPEPVEAPLLLADTASEIRWEPRGQVLVLSPWNYPILVTIAPLVGAIAAGNVVILKPSEKVPETNRALRTVLAEAFPENEVAMVEGDASVAEALLELPFDHVLFTGSTRVGKLVMAAAAKNLTSVTLELGGKSPAIVAPDAHLLRAAHAIAWGKFVNDGQTCVAPDYALIQEGQLQAFVDGLRAALEGSYGPTSGWATNPELARLVDSGAFARVKGLLDDAVQRGARVVIGGDANPGQRYLAPTVLVDVPADAPVLQEEIFGPVLPVVTYRTFEDALAYVRSRPKPLALYVFSRKNSTVDATLAETTSGGVSVNNTLLHLANPGLPFGGVGASGMGNYHGRAGFRTFSHERSVLRQQGNPMSRWLAPPYTSRMNRIVARLARWLE
jgi:aldehyde dehydrogenase (NAD+)